MTVQFRLLLLVADNKFLLKISFQKDTHLHGSERERERESSEMRYRFCRVTSVFGSTITHQKSITIP